MKKSGKLTQKMLKWALKEFNESRIPGGSASGEYIAEDDMGIFTHVILDNGAIQSIEKKEEANL